jgi:hypothetical protein
MEISQKVSFDFSWDDWKEARTERLVSHLENEIQNSNNQKLRFAKFDYSKTKRTIL